MTTQPKAPPCEMRELTTGVYAFLQTGGQFCSNQGLIVGKNYCIVIDTQTNKHMIENFIIKMKEVTDKPVRLVFNTHWHTDHTYTNYYFPEAIVFTTTKNREEMFRLNISELETFRKMFQGTIINFDGSQITPQDMTFDGTLTVYDGIHEIRFIDLGSGHCESDAIAYLPKEKIVYAGDLVHYKSGGFHSAPGVVALHSGSFRMIHVLDTLANMDAEIYVPGHGMGICSRQDIADQAIASIEYMITMREEARRLFNTGITYQEAAEKLDYSKFKKWGDKKTLYGSIFGGLARAWSQFRGEPPETPLDMEEIYAKSRPNPDGTYADRIDLGRTKKT